MRHWQIGLVAACGMILAAGGGTAAELHAELHKATPTGPGEAVGTVTIADSAAGAVVKAALKGLPPGPHGFHIHQNGSCAPTSANGQPVAAGGAGGHFDPANAGKHEGPQGNGHLGDLSVLDIATDGSSNASATAPHIKDVSQLHGKSVMVHAGGDNYSDQPQPLGGGGARIACGVLE